MESMITRINIPARKDNKVDAVKCNNCGYIRYPGKTYCKKCQGTDLSHVLFGPKGKVVTFTTSYLKKGEDKSKQRAYGVVRLFSEDEKSSIGVSGSFDTKNFDEIKIGGDVEMLPNDKYIIFKLMGA
jgi:uncharacterized OB-fold protein